MVTTVRAFFSGTCRPRDRFERPSVCPKFATAEPFRGLAAVGLPRLSGFAYYRVDGAADGALPQSAPRPDRGIGLRPRMAVGLRQAAAFALVAGRNGLPADRARFRLLPAGAGGRGRGVCRGLGDGA